MNKVPKLRFKEFSGEWEEKKLGELCNICTGKKDTQNKVENGKYPFFVRSQIVERINSYSFDGEAILTAGDGVGVGKVFHYINGKFDYHQRVYKLSDFKDCFGRFIFEKFKKDFIKEVKKYNAKTSVDSVRMEMITNMKIDIPTFREQEKIGNFLSSVDKKISIVEEKLNLFKEYKKGMMQKIFNQELRFKDENGNNYPEWEERKLEDILIKNKKKNKENKYTLVQSISNKYGFINQDEYFEDRRIASKDLKNYYIAKTKLFAYNPSRINVGSLAYKKDNNISVISPLYVSFYAKKEELIDKFLLNWFFSLPFIKQMSCSFEGSVRNNLSYETLSNFIINLPCLEEQQKIADFLSAIDDKIENISGNLENLKLFKKSLLQQMFV